jgi:predicted MPP superfamily phosphohydrolase
MHRDGKGRQDLPADRAGRGGPDQPTVAGLSRRGERTQLYTSRGTGFWGPPFRVFAPSEISLLTLRSA